MDDEALAASGNEEFGHHQFEFIVQFVINHEKERKTLSYGGAIVQRRASDSLSWTDSVTGLEYFDPGNFVYFSAYVALVGSKPKTEHWERKDESVGDVIEAILGFCWKTRREYSPDDAHVLLASPELHSGVSFLQAEYFWNIVVYNVYRLNFFEFIGM